MTRVYIFPSIQILVCLSSAIMYALAHDWRKAIYWLAAATITASVTF
jgi:hypothetical protein